MGVQGLSNSLTTLKSNLNLVDTDFTAISFTDGAGTSVLKSTYNAGNTILTKISEVPTGTAGQLSTFTGYKHFNEAPAAGTVGDVASNISTVLG